MLCFSARWSFVWDSTSPEEPSLLDFSIPPNATSTPEEQLQALREHDGSDDAEAPGDSESLPKDILTDVMHLWRSHNEQRAEKVMRHLWNCCPTLEQIDWYPRLKTDMDSVETLCRWIFVRENGDSNQRDSLARVTWDLLWTGCLQGDPEPIMNIRIGQEWEREMQKARKRYVMYYQDPCL